MTNSAQAQPLRHVAADAALTDWRGLAAAGAIAAIACDLLHELAHAATTLLPLGVETLVISTIGTTTHGSSPLVALAGPAANLLLSATLLLAGSSRVSPTLRYFAWLFGTFNLFDALAYLGYSAALGGGDWAVVFNAVAAPASWRPIVGAAGLLLYALAIVVSARVLGRWCLSVGADPRRMERLCFIPYWAGAITLIAGSLLNPAGRIYILTSGAATGLGAMIGLLLVPKLVARTRTGASDAHLPLRLGRRWTVSAATLGLVFILIFGPGVPL
jgi:hypothetical protein